MPQSQLPYSHPVPVATLHGDTYLKLAPTEAERAAIARDLGLAGLPALAFEGKVSHAQSGLVSVEGTLVATAQPQCVVTLEPFDQAIETPLAVRFAPEALVERMVKRAEENEVEDFEAPDVIEDGIIDFGQLVTEFLALSLDPYPKKPGAVFQGVGEPEAPVSPFAALAALKPKS